ncbi:MAG: hypothetical protein V1844_06070 [Pseudomonadota bacterium]
MLQHIKRILVVDEDAELRRSIIRHLRRNGFIMDSAFGDEDAGQKNHLFTKNRTSFSARVSAPITMSSAPGPLASKGSS